MRVKVTDKTTDVINSIRRYEIMLEIIANTADEIKVVHDKIANPQTAVLDGMPHQRNPHAGEDRLVAGIDIITSMRERYQTARIFVMWFEPMWKALANEEREILETYKYSDRFNGEMERYAIGHNISLRQAHRTRQKALGHLQSLLLGCL